MKKVIIVKGIWLICLLTIIYALSSCSSTHYSYNQARKKADKMVKNTQVQYTIVNNQIIMFENNQ
jgi:hypothetical protein